MCEILSVGNVRNEMSRVLETGGGWSLREAVCIGVRLKLDLCSMRDQISRVCGIRFVGGVRSETRTRV